MPKYFKSITVTLFFPMFLFDSLENGNEFSECGKIQTRKTPNTDISRSVVSVCGMFWLVLTYKKFSDHRRRLSSGIVTKHEKQALPL